MSAFRNTIAHIDLDAIRANYTLACDTAPGSQAIPAIKAEAYGHGMLAVARALDDLAPMLAVATVDEAMQLRNADIDKAILVLEGATSEASFDAAEQQRLALVVQSREQVAMSRQRNLDLWLKVDTGMHRLGLDPGAVQEVLDELGRERVRVVCTHLACADDPGSKATAQQLAVFEDCTADLELPRSIANSAGILAWPDSHTEYNRPGIMLYGASPFAPGAGIEAPLKPAMRFVSEVIAVRDVASGESVGYGARWTAAQPARVATVAAGYADGYPRHAPNGTPVAVDGSVVPLAGTVSMDMLTVDVSTLPDVRVGSPVELWGETVPVTEVARQAGTISYELLTGVSARVPRRYTGIRAGRDR